MLEELEQFNVGHFGFSAVHPDNLGATEYTEVVLICDRSGSTAGFQKDMEACLKEIVKACQMSPRADNLLLRTVAFSNTVDQIHGFKLLDQINIGDYDGTLAPRSSTLLYDAIIDGVESAINYGVELTKQEFTTNAIVFIMTDGLDSSLDGSGGSKYTKNSIKDSLASVVQKECLESINTILIGVNVKNQNISKELQSMKDECGLTQYVELQDATAKTLAKLAQFVSKSISSQSQSLGSKGASQPITF